MITSDEIDAYLEWASVHYGPSNSDSEGNVLRKAYSKDKGARYTSSEPAAILQILEPAPEAMQKSSVYVRMMQDAARLISYHQDAWPETPSNVARVQGMLDAIPADLSEDLWKKMIWSVASLGWVCGEDLLLKWSRRSSAHWAKSVDEGAKALEQLQSAYQRYDPQRGITVASLIHEARKNGYSEPSSAPQEVAKTTARSTARSLTGNGVAFELLTRRDLDAIPPMKYLVQGVFPELGVAVIYGAPVSGKTFFTLDLCAHMASGKTWNGRATEKRPLVYVGLEGMTGIRGRIRAWENDQNSDLEGSALFVKDPLFLNDERYVDEFIEVAQTLERGSVIVIDTLAKASPGTDENSAAEMGNAQAAAERIAKSADGLVILIHHSGKDSGRGMRGSSALGGNVDAVIKVTRNRSTDIPSWEVEKLKDDRDDAKGSFDLQIKTLDDGITTSCVVRHLGAVAEKTTRRMPGKNQSAILSALQDNTGAGHEWSREALIELAKATLGKTVPAKHVASRVAEAVDGLISGGYLEKSHRGYTLTISPDPD